jgi:hypothetical protein
MQYRWLVGLIGMTVLAVVLAFALPAHESSAGSLDQEAEQEQTVKYGVTSCGVELWSIKTGTDNGARVVNQKAVVPSTIFHLRSLPAPSSALVTSRLRPVETTVYSVSAILLRHKYETDSDIHLVIADTGGRTMIAEMPAPQCVGASSPFLPSIRYVRSKFTSQFHPSTSWNRVNTPIQIAGVGFFDFKHGQSGVAPNAIELHPVLRFSTGAGSSTLPPARQSASHSRQYGLQGHSRSVLRSAQTRCRMARIRRCLPTVRREPSAPQAFCIQPATLLCRSAAPGLSLRRAT